MTQDKSTQKYKSLFIIFAYQSSRSARPSDLYRYLAMPSDSKKTIREFTISLPKAVARLCRVTYIVTWLCQVIAKNYTSVYFELLPRAIARLCRVTYIVTWLCQVIAKNYTRVYFELFLVCQNYEKLTRMLLTFSLIQ